MPFSDQPASSPEADKPSCILAYVNPAAIPHPDDHPRKPIEDGPDTYRHRVRSGGYKSGYLG
jgi:hypothetical protein